MANGQTTQAMLLEMAIKQGSATVLAGLLLWAFWAVVIEPGAAERKSYSETITETSRENATAVKQQVGILHDMQETNTAIQLSTERQASTLQALSEEMEGQTELREQAMDTMNAFAKEMRDVNPANAKKLDLLMEKILREDDWAVKLDMLIEDLRTAHPELNHKPEPEEP